ncbi:hypothetical protein BV25DRAFT_1823794 [Artomyces pyxidatus]|uniref:Uncharacterized protein n=1 Tax=Artomyces pyxidatus TaxID=48021 RepID=A0ACB8T4R3_9AGAM|nr:hypothetical protein BV25DRAFT_1823794 [Artomyces pyxidatus]
MSEAKFVNDQLVDEYPTEATQKIDDDELTKREIQRLSNSEKPDEPGVSKRAGAASRDPAEYDTQSRATNAYGDTKPVQDPVT